MEGREEGGTVFALGLRVRATDNFVCILLDRVTQARGMIKRRRQKAKQQKTSKKEE